MLSLYSPPLTRVWPGTGGAVLPEDSLRMTPPLLHCEKACPNKIREVARKQQLQISAKQVYAESQLLCSLFVHAAVAAAAALVRRLRRALVAVRHRPAGSWARSVGCAPSCWRLCWQAATATCSALALCQAAPARARALGLCRCDAHGVSAPALRWRWTRARSRCTTRGAGRVCSVTDLSSSDPTK